MSRQAHFYIFSDVRLLCVCLHSRPGCLVDIQTMINIAVQVVSPPDWEIPLDTSASSNGKRQYENNERCTWDENADMISNRDASRWGGGGKYLIGDDKTAGRIRHTSGNRSNCGKVPLHVPYRLVPLQPLGEEPEEEVR